MNSEDILQSVFLSFYTKAPHFVNEQSAAAWLFTAARNSVFELFRSKQYKADQFNVMDTDDVQMPDTHTPEEVFLSGELTELIMKALSGMSPENKEVYLLREYGGLSYREISTVTGLSLADVKVRLHRTRKLLIEEITKKIE